MNIILAPILAFLAGVLVASGSGFVPPFEWLTVLGLAADKHLIIGGILIILAMALHVSFGGKFWPSGNGL
jgi:hypothetical protein